MNSKFCKSDKSRRSSRASIKPCLNNASFISQPVTTGSPPLTVIRLDDPPRASHQQGPSTSTQINRWSDPSDAELSEKSDQEGKGDVPRPPVVRRKSAVPKTTPVKSRSRSAQRSTSKTVLNPEKAPYFSKKAQAASSPTAGCDDRLSYRLLGSVKEKSHSANIYGVAFNNWVGKTADIFATCGDEVITVYECSPQLPGGFKPLFCYTVPDENFYSVDWSMDISRPGTSYLVAAGLSGKIRRINMANKLAVVLGFHPNPINDVKVHRGNAELLATASDDGSMRLWNVRNAVLIAVFHAAECPLGNQLVTVSFHDTLPLIACSGLDHIIRLWNYDTDELKAKIRLAANWHLPQEGQTFTPAIVHLPHFETRDVHGNYVDSLSWWGDCLISRSSEEQIVIWKCGREGEDDLMKLKYDVETFRNGKRLFFTNDVEANPNQELVKVEDDNTSNESYLMDVISVDEALASLSMDSASKSYVMKTVNPNVRIFHRLNVPNSSNWFLRFALDPRQTLLAFGDMDGDLSIFYLDGQKTDPKGGRSFAWIKQMTIPQRKSIRGKYVRQVAFNYTSQLLVSVTDGCYVNLYRIKVHNQTGDSKTVSAR